MNHAEGAAPAVIRQHATIPVGPGLYGDLAVPPNAAGVTIFAHGSGSSRFSPRNRLVADALNRRGIATFLFDLLTPAEEPQRTSVFDVELLGDRLEQTTRWLLEQPLAEGSGAVLLRRQHRGCRGRRAAAQLGPTVRAVVSRGGRPDLAGTHLPRVDSPTLLIVGEDDPVVLDLNRQALAALTCERRLVIVRTAGHLFEEPGTLERVSELAGDWLSSHLAEAPRRRRSRRATSRSSTRPDRTSARQEAVAGARELVEQCDHLGVLDLREAVVPEADGTEAPLLVRAHHLVRLTAERSPCSGPRPPGTATTTRAAPRLRAQRTAATIVAPVASPSSTSTAVLPRSSSGWWRSWRRRSSASAFSCACSITTAEVGLGEPFVRAEVDAAGTRRDGPDPVLGLKRVADLANRECVEGQRQATCDLGRHRDAAAGKATTTASPSCMRSRASARWRPASRRSRKSAPIAPIVVARSIAHIGRNP